jgi:hypothetical protein
MTLGEIAQAIGVTGCPHTAQSMTVQDMHFGSTHPHLFAALIWGAKLLHPLINSGSCMKNREEMDGSVTTQ